MLAFTMTFNSTVDFTRIRSELKNASRYRGIYSRVGKRLGVSPQHVKEVAMGRRRSARVQDAIKKEFLNIHRSAA